MILKSGPEFCKMRKIHFGGQTQLGAGRGKRGSSRRRSEGCTLPPRFGTHCPVTGGRNGKAQHRLRSLIYPIRSVVRLWSVWNRGPGMLRLRNPLRAGPGGGGVRAGDARQGSRTERNWPRSEFRLPPPAPAGPRPPLPAHLGPEVKREPIPGEGFRLALSASGSKCCTQRTSDGGKDNC